MPHAFVTEREARLDARAKQEEADRKTQALERRVGGVLFCTAVYVDLWQPLRGGPQEPGAGAVGGWWFVVCRDFLPGYVLGLAAIVRRNCTHQEQRVGFHAGS